MRFLKAQNLNKFRRTDRAVYVDTVGRVEMRRVKTLLLPKGDTTGRPASPENGQIRYNTDTPDIEAYVDNSWRNLRYKEATSIVQQSLGYGDYVEQYFGPLNPIPVAGQNVLVLIENVLQLNTVNYTLVQNPPGYSSGWYLYFGSPPPNKLITVLHNFDK
jgi:hypothetical protein